MRKYFIAVQRHNFGAPSEDKAHENHNGFWRWITTVLRRSFNRLLFTDETLIAASWSKLRIELLLLYIQHYKDFPGLIIRKTSKISTLGFPPILLARIFPL